MSPQPSRRSAQVTATVLNPGHSSRPNDDALQAVYAEQYDSLDTELARAEIALLHATPEDIRTARSALRGLRDGLTDVALDLEARSSPDAP